ncbi:glycoside hydrolase family 71/99-like protein [uncultured Maribacter sp.]|uniref:glycoside hydrolase family 71/99-like protein n=1 Tax=uncultured Maribacter sp. TaxID=431308 RepID=UPI002630016A|nr:glycoside hydrolase family 71/99-like protein [uncultured Maribacter sp.]
MLYNKKVILILVGVFFLILASCEKEKTKDFKESKQEVFSTEATEIIPDSILRAVLDEEDSFKEATLAGRIVDISGMDVVKDNPKKVYAHYMPWFQSLDFDGYWGQHWTMATKNPNTVDANGKREIASYYYPIIGPYSSNDPDLQEYHFLMMKLSGIDGVIFDWYGSKDVYDYQLIKQSTETFMNRLQDLGMEFSIMYEDRVAQDIYNAGLSTSVVNAATMDFNYIKNTYFTKSNFLKHNSKELMFVFGPETITTTSDWDSIFSVFPQDQEPYFLTLWAAQNMVGNNASGEFLWVAGDHLLAHEYYYDTYLTNNLVTVGSSYPGFNSFYEEGGWGLNHTWNINHADGDTFVETLNYTHHEAADFIQLVTWNDFGEGTMLEPTEEYGFLNLQLLQEYTGVSYVPQDLQVALDLYKARKEFKGNAAVEYYLNRTYKKIKQSELGRARLILRAVNRLYGSK